jgi:F5/8 type C domain
MRSRVALGLAAGLYLLLTIALTWPLLLHPGSRVPSDLGDSLLNMFLLAWNAREVPLTPHWWNLPMFFPIPGVLAFSEHLLGLSLIADPVIWVTGNVLLAYNVAFFLSFPLCAIGAHLLTYQITKRHDLALVAGLAYGFAPYRMAQFAHIQVLSSYWMPFALLGLHKFIERPRWSWLVLFAVSWYFQALACGYYLFYLSVLIGLWLLWFAIGRIRWADFGRLTIAWAVTTLAFLPIALGYLKYQRAYGLRRWPDEIQAFSADVASVLKGSGNLRLWGWLNVVDRPESALFPGVALILVIVLGVVLAWTAAAHGQLRRLRATRLLLAGALLFGIVAATPLWLGPWKLDVFGIRLLSVRTAQKPFSVAVLLAVVAFALHPSIRAGWGRRSALAFYTLAAVAMWLFSLGPAPTLMNKPLLYKAPYAWLMLVPGVEGVRVPARFWVLATLCLAVACALALGYIVERLPTLRRPLVAIVAVLVLVEAWPVGLPLIEAPAWRPSSTSAVSRLELPTGSIQDLIALYRATQHRRPLANGYSGYFAPHYGAQQELLGRRNPAVFRHLASFGELEVIVNHDRDGDRFWRSFLSTQPSVQLVSEEKDYTVYRVPQNSERLRVPQFSTAPLSIAGIRASTAQDRVNRMTDGDLITRWDTAGPQDPTNVVTIDLGAPKQVEGVETLIGGYLADFPRLLAIDLSEDGVSWSTAWEGETALMTYVAALEMPRTVPLRIPLANRRAQYIRMRQTGADRTWYWTIAELKVFGS